MESIKNELYEVPSVLVLGLETEGVVCNSPFGTQDYNSLSLDEND